MSSRNEYDEVNNDDAETENEENEALMDVITQSMEEQRRKSQQDIERSLIENGMEDDDDQY